MVRQYRADYKYTLNANETFKQLATSGGHEIVAVVCTGGSGGAAVRVYDSASGAGEGSPHTDAFLISANGGESSSFCPAQSVPMNKGIYIELEQSAGNAEAFIVYN